MKFDGANYRICHRVIRLPDEYSDADRPHYQAFGKKCKASAKGAVKTNYSYVGKSPFKDPPETVEGVEVYPVYAKKIPSDGYSLTNLMYGKDGYAYLAYDGAVYCRKCKLKREPVSRESLKRILKMRLDPLTESGLQPNDDAVLNVLADYIIPLSARILDGKVSFVQEKTA